MGAGEEIDLTGLDKQIKDVQNDIQKLGRSFDIASKNIQRFGDLSEKTNVNVFKSDLQSTSKILEDFRKQIGSGNAEAVKSFQALIEQLRTLKGTASELGMTNVIEQLNKVQNASAQAGAIAATTILNSLKQSSVYAQQTANAQQHTAQSASQAASATKGQADAQKKASDEASKTLKNEEQILKNAKSLQKTLEQIQEEKVLTGDKSAIQEYLKQEKSIKRINNALAGLRAAQENCNLATKKGQQEYAKLGQQIKSLEFMLGRNANIADRLSSAFSKSKSMVEQLAMSFGVMTGVFGATNFVKQLYKITAEFQLQQRALGAIIQNTREANVLFKQMQSLAVESPMKFMDLNRYAKQLAAFRIETTNLYDSLKMLGDIAVGVGVDMDRLILAYGQVKAANYLRGQELRQFSEAGVNILGGLQEYYRETKNINMSINEIFDSVSKRKVLFEDVDAVLKRMTQSGGEFYNMQLIQSQTLYGQLQKLGDLFQISMNKIGTSTSGVLLKVITTIQFFIRHLREVISIMVAWAGSALFVKLIRNFAAITSGAKSLAISLKEGWVVARALGSTRFTALTTSIWNAKIGMNALTIGIQAAAAAFAFFLARHQEAKAKREEIQRSLVEEISEYNKRMSEMKTIEQAYSKDKTFSGRIALLQQLIEKAKEYKMALEIDENITQSNIDKNFESASKQIEEYTHQVLLYKSALYSVDVNEALEKLNATNLEFANASLGYQNMMNMLIGDYEHLSDEQKKMVDNLREIDEAFSKNEEEAVKKYKMTNEQWKIARLERMQIMAGITTNAQNITLGGRSVQGLSEAENTFLKNAVTDLTKFTSSYKKALANAKKELEPAIKKVISPDDFVGTEEEYKKAVQTKISAVIDAFADAGEFAKQNMPDLVSDILDLDKSYTATIIFEAQKAKTDATNTNLQRLIDDIANSDENGYVRTLVYDVEIKRTGDLPDFIGTQVEAEQALIDPLQQVNEERKNELETAMRIVKAVQDAVGGEKEKEKTFKDEVQKYQEYLKLIERGKKNQIEEEVIKTRMNQLMGTQFHTLQDMINYINTELSNAKIFGDRMLYEWPEDKSSSTRAKSMKSEYQSMIDFVRELNREFDTLRKNFNEKDSAKWAGATNRILSSFEAKFGAMPTKFKKAFQNTLRSIDFTTKEGTVEAENIVKGLIDSAKDLTKKEKEELQRAWGEAVGQIKLEAELELKAREDERLKAQVQKMFDDYNLTIELGKLGVDAEEVGKLFNIDTKDLLTLEKKLESMKEEFVGRNMEKEYRQFMRKIVEINDKANLEMAKKYVKYLREEYGERAKVELEYMRQRAEIYALPFDENETMRILDNLQKETQKKLDEIDWKTFTSSDMYIEVFEDLERVSNKAIESMLRHLEELKSSLKNLSPSDLKAITEQMQKLRDEMIKRNPFKSLADSIKEYKSATKDLKTRNLINEVLGEKDLNAPIKNFRKTLDEAVNIARQKQYEAKRDVDLKETLLGAGKERDEAKKMLEEQGVDWRDIYNSEELENTLKDVEKKREEAANKISNDRLAKILSGEEDRLGLSENEQEYLKYDKLAKSIGKLFSARKKFEENGGDPFAEFEDLQINLDKANESLKKVTSQANQLADTKKRLDDWAKAVKAMGELLGDWTQKAKESFDSIYEGLESIGVGTDTIGQAWKEFGDEMFDTISRALQMLPAMVASITTAETAINAAAGWIGLIAEAITLIMSGIKAISGLHDSYKQAEIEKLQKSLDKLEKTAEDLSEAFESSYAEEELRQLDAALIRTRELAIATLEDMKEAEEAKKKSDQAVIDDYQNQIDSLNKEMQEGIENFYEALGGFGSAANMKSTVEEWTDAWYEAFKETGDGLSGLEDSFEEFFENIVKKHLMNNIMTKYFGDNFLSGLDKILGTEGGVMGNLDALNDWINQYHDLAVQADEEMQAAVNAIQSVTGIGGGLEGLQAGLQGMTEETADILAAYLNSVRFYVADNNQLLQNLLNGLTIDNNSNPMLQQLKIVAAQTTSINLLLDSVVHSGGYQGNGGGSYLKVHAILES